MNFSFLCIISMIGCVLITFVVVYLMSVNRTRDILHERDMLRFELDKVNLIMEESPSLIVISDNKGIIKYVNPSYSEITGYLPDDVVGKNVRILKSGQLSDVEYKRIWDTICSAKEWKGELPNKKKNGEIYWEKVVILPIRDKDGVITDFVKLGEDITVRKRAEEGMKKVISIKSEFTSMVSHELRTPLTAIKEIISIVLRGAVGEINDEQRDFLDTAKKNIDRLARFINDVLDFQKIGSGKMPFYIQKNDMNDVVKEIYRSMNILAKDKGLELLIDLDKNLPEINFDKDKIIQVITNLVNNAIKFTNAGRVKIRTIKEDLVVHVIVEDTGRGIRKEDLPRLFQSFEQIGDPETRKAGGSGLGLAISREIISKHRGKIWAESEYGKGSSFQFVLPIVERRA
ncbi:MAG: ATP-binding protein [Candidatus Omnitrophota bacterium]